MAEEKKPVEKTPPAPKLGRAAESGDAAVHNLLAERHVHEANGDTAAVADVDSRLAEFGYAV
jgi:hypothetical protein